MAPKLSVVIPCFNHGAFIREAVTSVTNVARDDVELIVVDDGSTEERTRREMDLLTGEGVRVIRQENKGLAGARNAGIEASRGEYILPLDADNRIRGAYVTRGISILDCDLKTGVVYGDAMYFGTRTGRWTVGEFERERLLRWNYIDACAVFRRSVWEQNRGYDETMPVQGLEDWDFWLGAVTRGWKFFYVPEILFDYRVAKESMITRTWGLEKQVEEFIARKHGALYRQAWQQALNDRESLRNTFRNLGALLQRRLAQKLRK